MDTNVALALALIMTPTPKPAEYTVDSFAPQHALVRLAKAPANDCGCQSGGKCVCAAGRCHCHAHDPATYDASGAFWKPSIYAGQYNLMQGNKQIGGWDGNVFRWVEGDEWSEPCKCPVPPPAPESFQQTNLFPTIRTVRSSGSC